MFGDPTLGSGALNHLVRSCRAVGVTVAVPEMVVLELVAQYDAEMRTRLGAASKAISNLERYIYTEKLPALSVDAQSLEAGYEEWFRNKLNDMGILILKLPDVPQQVITERALKKRRPFTTKGGDAGYKDALIWETILEFLDSSLGPVVFVTNDSGFCHGNESKIHGDLEIGLKSRGHSILRVTIQKHYEGTTKFLNDEYESQKALDEEDWAQVSKEELESEIPFGQLLNRNKSTILSVLASNLDYLDELGLPWDVEPDNVEFEPEYIGNGEWKISGTAYWETELEYYDFNLPQMFAEKGIGIDLTIDFTIYYDYKDKEIAHETIIDSVSGHPYFGDE